MMKSVIVIAGFVASVLTIYIFVTGNTSLNPTDNSRDATSYPDNPKPEKPNPVSTGQHRPTLKAKGYEILSCSCENIYSEVKKDNLHSEKQCLSQTSTAMKCKKGDVNYRLCQDEWGNPRGVSLKVVCT